MFTNSLRRSRSGSESLFQCPAMPTSTFHRQYQYQHHLPVQSEGCWYHQQDCNDHCIENVCRYRTDMCCWICPDGTMSVGTRFYLSVESSVMTLTRWDWAVKKSLSDGRRVSLLLKSVRDLLSPDDLIAVVTHRLHLYVRTPELARGLREDNVKADARSLSVSQARLLQFRTYCLP